MSTSINEIYISTLYSEHVYDLLDIDSLIAEVHRENPSVYNTLDDKRFHFHEQQQQHYPSPNPEVQVINPQLLMMPNLCFDDSSIDTTSQAPFDIQLPLTPDEDGEQLYIEYMPPTPSEQFHSPKLDYAESTSYQETQLRQDSNSQSPFLQAIYSSPTEYAISVFFYQRLSPIPPTPPFHDYYINALFAVPPAHAPDGSEWPFLANGTPTMYRIACQTFASPHPTNPKRIDIFKIFSNIESAVQGLAETFTIIREKTPEAIVRTGVEYALPWANLWYACGGRRMLQLCWMTGESLALQCMGPEGVVRMIEAMHDDERGDYKLLTSEYSK